jgi:hemerythrin-like domain-containing protein
MGLFGSNQKKIIEDLHKKSEDHSKEITKEINELLNELKSDYDENDEVVNEFSSFVEEIKTKLSPEDATKLVDFSSRLSKVKRCAKKGVDAMRELARDQRKLTSETRMEYEEYFYTR